MAKKKRETKRHECKNYKSPKSIKVTKKAAMFNDLQCLESCIKYATYAYKNIRTCMYVHRFVYLTINRGIISLIVANSICIFFIPLNN